MDRRPFFDVIGAFILITLCCSLKAEPQVSKQSAAPGKWQATKWGQSFKPKDGYVPDSKTAMEIAKAVLIAIYGDEVVRSEEPFTASLDGNIWTIKGAVRPYPSGNAEAKLSKSDGTILFVTHSQ